MWRVKEAEYKSSFPINVLLCKTIDRYATKRADVIVHRYGTVRDTRYVRNFTASVHTHFNRPSKHSDNVFVDKMQFMCERNP